MQKETTIASEVQELNYWYLKVIEVSIYLLVLIFACLIAVQGKGTISVNSIAVLLPATIFSLIPVKHISIVTIQKLISIYLIFVLVEHASGYYFGIEFSNSHINFSASIPIIALCLLSYLIGRFIGKRESAYIAMDKELKAAWRLALAVLVLHILFLVPLLAGFYGYGYERSAVVLGRIFLYYFLFMSYWRPLSQWILRGSVGIIFFFFCFMNYYLGSQ